MKLNRNQWICLGFLGMLFALSGVERMMKKEMYPSLVFPSFSNAPKDQKSATFPVAEIYGTTSQNEKVKIDESKLIIDENFRHSYFLINNIVEKGNSNRYTPEELKDLRNYLVQSIQKNVHLDIKSVSFIAGTKSFDFTKKMLDPKIYDEKTFTIQLN